MIIEFLQKYKFPRMKEEREDCYILRLCITVSPDTKVRIAILTFEHFSSKLSALFVKE